MKRILFSTIATVLGLVGLLSFKTHGHPLSVAGGLPSVTAGSASGTSAAASSTTASAGATTSAPPDPSASKSTATETSRTVKGSAVQTQYGVVQVAVTVTGTKIDAVRFVRLEAFDGRSQQINSYAAPILLRETISAQSAHIDSVSGATYTSDGYMQSLQSALDAAGIK